MVLTKNIFSPKICEKIFSGISSISVFGTGPVTENGTNREFYFSPKIFEQNVFPQFLLFRFLDHDRCPKMVLTGNFFPPKFLRKIFPPLSPNSVFGSGPVSEIGLDRKKKKNFLNKICN